MNGFLDAYLSAMFQTWCAAKTDARWHGFWRLKKLGIEWQLKNAQKIGKDIELKGPVIINNQGTIEIQDNAYFDSTWHKPIYINLTRPEAKLTIEHHAGINYGVEISVVKDVFIGAYSMVSIDCLIYDTDWHNPDNDELEADAQPTRIGRGVWMGARVMVLKGVTIGDNTVVAANSVVTKDLPGNVLAGGTPARVIRPIGWNRYRGSTA